MSEQKPDDEQVDTDLIYRQRPSSEEYPSQDMPAWAFVALLAAFVLIVTVVIALYLGGRL